MSEGWTVRQAEEADLADQARLFNVCFRKDKQSSTFRWRYLDNPHGRAISRVACDPRGQVVGSYSYVPRRFLRNGRPVVLMQASDAMTAPDWRGRGIFTGLDDVVCDAAAGAGAPLAFAYSGRLSLRGFLGNGWQLIGHARLYRRPFRTRRALLRLGRAGPIAALAAPALDVVQGWRDRVRLKGSVSLQRIDRFDQRVDDLFAACAPRHGLVGDRSAQWLNWRYVDTPTGRQERLGLFRGERLDAYVVAEFTDGNAYLVDHLARDGVVREAALRAFTALAWGRGMQEASALLFDHHPAVPLLRRLGFHRPLRKRPFRERFPFIVRRCRADAPEEDLDMTRWHLTDGDRDAEHMSP